MSLKKKRKDDNHKEFAIGTKIEYNGKLYEVVEELFCDNCSIANICNNAEFTNIKKSDNLLSREQRYSIFGECSNYNRADEHPGLICSSSIPDGKTQRRERRAKAIRRRKGRL